ncbi:phage baseplate assembly protein domain-containing protein [Rhizobium sp. Root1203]|uniref:phage baseplate assembly protein domain-containing protein n=1 Tax=Rhizobium sp. Root1203 TaxID=1736427 RepID=UPI0009EC4E32|nr:phage baseplate assembly protein [Rhizobium sp. Root1203]
MMRFDFDGRVEEKGGQQFVSGRGPYGDAWSRIYRPEPHGFASSPIAGGKGFVLPRPGAPDFALVIGGEHPGKRPVLENGGAAIYDAFGNIQKFVAAGIVVDVAGRTITTTAGGWVLNGPATINGDLQVNGSINATGAITDSDGNDGA